MSFYNPGNNVNLWIKHTFISFAQAYFSNDSKFAWDINPVTTKLIIADKFAVDLGVVEKKPSIILSRGNFGWTDTIRGQDGQNTVLSSKKVDTLFPEPSADRLNDFVFTDMLRGSVTYNVLSTSGIEAEEIANRLFVALSAYKRDFKKYGIHKTYGLAVGDERIIKNLSKESTYGVTVSLGFQAQRTIQKSAKFNNVQVTADFPKETTTGTISETLELHENIDYTVLNNGTTVEFTYPPAAEVTNLTVSFVNAIDLETVSTELVGDVDGENTTYIIPSGAVFGYYTLSSQIIVSGLSSISGLSEPEDPFLVIVE